MACNKELKISHLLEETLSYWDQAGERPYEVLREQGLYEFFIAQLSKQSLVIEGKIYRGTKRHFQLEIGETLLYTYPSSWTYDLEIAHRFVDGEANQVILVLSSIQPIKAIENSQNSYGEDEVIIHPITLRVINKYRENEFTILEVIPD